MERALEGKTLHPCPREGASMNIISKPSVWELGVRGEWTPFDLDACVDARIQADRDEREKERCVWRKRKGFMVKGYTTECGNTILDMGHAFVTEGNEITPTPKFVGCPFCLKRIALKEE